MSVQTDDRYPILTKLISDTNELYEQIQNGEFNVDTSSLQPKTDNALTTTDKTVVGAINENKSTLENIVIQVEDIKNNPTTPIDDTVESINKVWSSAKVKEQILLIPKGDKGEKGEKGDSGTASLSIDDTVTNTISTWSSAKIKNEIMINNQWSGKKILCVGDSITDNSTANTKYHYYIANKIGCTIANSGISGSGYVAYGTASSTNALINRIDSLPLDVDLIFVFLGTNDWMNNDGIAIGVYGDTTTTTFYGGLDFCYKNLIEKYPYTPIVVATPLPRTNGLTTNGKGLTIEPYIEAIKKMAKKYCLPLLNLYEESNFYVYNSNFRSQYVTDGLHPTTLWHEKYLAPIVLDFFNKIPYYHNPILDSGTTYGNIVLNKTSVTITEGGTGTFTVSLDKAPTNNQIVTLSKTNSDVSLSATTLTFTPLNWNIVQTVTITVAEDDSDYSNESDTITLTSPNVVTKIVSVTITDNDTAPSNIPVTGITVTPSTASISTIGGTQQLTANILPSNATNKAITWSSSNTGVATVDNTGNVTSVANGSATITCTASDTTNNAKGTSSITVSVVPESGLNFTTDTKSASNLQFNFINLLFDISSIKGTLSTSDLYTISFDFEETTDTGKVINLGMKMFNGNTNSVTSFDTAQIWNGDFSIKTSYAGGVKSFSQSMVNHLGTLNYLRFVITLETGSYNQIVKSNITNVVCKCGNVNLTNYFSGCGVFTGQSDTSYNNIVTKL